MDAWIRRHYLDRPAYMALARRARQDYEVRLSSLAYGTQLASIIRKRIEAERSKDRAVTGPCVAIASNDRSYDRKRRA
jgi:hypothetical protein